MSNERFTYLIKGWLAEQLSSEEIDEFLSALQDTRFTTLLGDDLVASLVSGAYPVAERIEDKERILRQLHERIEGEAATHKKPRAIKWMGRWAAAAAFIGLCATAYFYFGPKLVEKEGQVAVEVTYPTTTIAVITLPDGTKLRTDTLKDKVLLQKYGLLFLMADTDKLVVGPIAGGVVDSLSKITIDNPRGSASLQVRLADGSSVWLNSQSSITYSPSFKARGREVEISGEAYFEVAKDPTRKFVVKSKKMTTEVLGTHFDMRAYEDEAVSKVTLIEGSVKIYNNKTAQSREIVPNQQASVAVHNISVKTANTQDVMAWKNELLSFNGSDIETIMREVGRWYDVEVSYENPPTDRKFSGVISRKTPLSDVLQILHKSGIDFKVAGKHITVY